MGDTGLLVTHSFMDDKFTDNELYRDIPLDRLYVNEGMLMENIVAQELRKICPVEVKSGGYRKHSSLDKFRSKFKGKIGQPYILYTKDIMVKEDVVHFPIYMAMFL